MRKETDGERQQPHAHLDSAHPERVINQPGGLNAIDGVNADANPYGTWLIVPDDVDEALEESGYTPLADAEQPRRERDGAGEEPKVLPEIEQLWRYARAHDCDVIRLDADEGIDPNLPVYDDWT